MVRLCDMPLVLRAEIQRDCVSATEKNEESYQKWSVWNGMSVDADLANGLNEIGF